MANYKNVAGAAVFATCAILCTSFEGLRTTAYPDMLAGGLPTVCIGETEGVKLGDKYTPLECKQMLAKKLPRYWNEINQCIHVPISNHEKIAYIDFAYNVGTGAFCGSSLLKKLNADNHEAACDGLLKWDVASGVHVPGLLRRRQAERSYCLKPDPTPPIVIAAPAPVPHTLTCRGWWFWKVCS